MTEFELREHIIGIASSYIGTQRGDAKHKALVDYYNSHPPLARSYKASYTDDWCDLFVSTIGMMADDRDLIGTEVGVGKHINIFKTLGCWVEQDNYVPQKGDIIVFYWSANPTGEQTTGASHIGFVADCDGKTITTIEGNMGANSVVGTRQISVDHKWIRGFATPNYKSKAKDVCTVTTRILVKGMRGTDVRNAMVMLKDQGYYPWILTKKDQLFGNNMEKAIANFQKDHKLPVSKILDETTWNALMN